MYLPTITIGREGDKNDSLLSAHCKDRSQRLAGCSKNFFFDEPKILHETILGLAEFSAWAIKKFRLFLVKEGGKERAGAGRRRKFCAPLGWRGVLKGDSREFFFGRVPGYHSEIVSAAQTVLRPRTLKSSKNETFLGHTTGPQGTCPHTTNAKEQLSIVSVC